jgi:DNA-binding XRE family transcriptional regulator
MVHSERNGHEVVTVDTSARRKLAERAEVARGQTGLTQAELAKQLGVSEDAVSQWEAGAEDRKLLAEARRLGMDHQQAVAAAREQRWRERRIARPCPLPTPSWLAVACGVTAIGISDAPRSTAV